MADLVIDGQRQPKPPAMEELMLLLHPQPLVRIIDGDDPEWSAWAPTVADQLRADVNFFPFHIGDYAVHTRHLTLMEDLAYRRLLDLYYTREKPLPNDEQEVARLIGMREQVAEVNSVLAEFFDNCGDGWFHDRCDIEIAKMHAKQDNARASAAKRAVNAPASQANRERDASVTEAIATNTNTNTKKRNTAPAAPIVGLEAIPQDLLDEWKGIRSAKRAGKITPTVVKALEREAAKAGLSVEAAVRKCVERAWVGFEADWLRDPKQKLADVARMTVPGPPPSNFLAEQAAHRAQVEAERLARKQA